VRQLNAGTPYSGDRADGDREMRRVVPPARPRKIAASGVLRVAGPLIEVKADPPR
jgi:hypothetical protein